MNRFARGTEAFWPKYSCLPLRRSPFSSQQPLRMSHGHRSASTVVATSYPDHLNPGQRNVAHSHLFASSRVYPADAQAPPNINNAQA
ncbi:GD25527 [Drosophila simulans]|uniref:GD25527 n=2 Tax=melanogaster subgroup TaxID=32351 RepID=B4QI15_DROSI|nr:GD25527 [Drosophila simulans]